MSNQSTPPTHDPARLYFQAPTNYFWRWAEAGEIAEWENGVTISYRDELQVVVAALAARGVPPLGAVLLLLAACSEGWPTSGGQGVLAGLASVFKGRKGTAELQFYLNQACRFMDLVHALPPELRTGPKKLHLFQEVFPPATTHRGGAKGQKPTVGRTLSFEESQGALAQWASGRLDEALRQNGPVVGAEYLLADLQCLDQAFQRFPSTELLALRLRTGLDQVPAPLPEPVVPEVPAEEPTDLLDQLTQDPRTAGLARLTQRLVAALRIPLHTRQASEQPLGGIADVTNRGNFDRLLLSELAHDDLTLMARLVNNEALYLRREAPPAPEVRPRAVLLDTTLRMWGVPRVFALAAALAWTRNSQHGRPPAPVQAYALGGQQAEPIDLASFDGVVETLSRLDVALHAGAALLDFARSQPAAADSLLITDAELLRAPEFLDALAEAKTALHYLLTVSRSGELQLYEFHNGHRTLLSTSSFALEELLLAPAPRRPQRNLPPTSGPAFLQQQPAPLLFPTTGLRVSPRNTFYQRAVGVLAVTDVQRVLYWPYPHTGARELLPEIEPGDYSVGTNCTTELYVLVSSAEVLRVYRLGIGGPEMEVESVDLDAELTHSEVVEVVFKDLCFYVRRGASNLVFDCQAWNIKERALARLPEAASSGFKPDFGRVKRHINNGYTPLLRIKRLGVNGSGDFVVEHHVLQLRRKQSPHSDDFYLNSPSPNSSSHRASDIPYAAQFVDESTLPGNERVRLQRFRWPGGSEAVVDSRGLLHLRSADASVPEITLTLVLGQPLAFWAADGTVCGPTYFTGVAREQSLSAPEFYEQYLRRFISSLID
ncbi:hypothetical protein [Hymenobacter chitinivorans]|uniref:Uncharacterized protein n=1 Tax=Hymenobacter chitinivorans DSM 11115 TaxID=1121954 RepID=A0A2M9BPR8_9BACT|nr:hypothetical protein [Hymenobacter chitinivorans]PJJ59945.1 hypothetical protein CLV45_1367 [Hymenobacter chitinivorans DSM 11115]